MLTSNQDSAFCGLEYSKMVFSFYLSITTVTIPCAVSGFTNLNSLYLLLHQNARQSLKKGL